MSKNFIYDTIQHPAVSRWVRQLAERQTAVFLRLTSENRNRLKGVLGDPKQKMREGRNDWVWKVERGNLVVWVLSGDMGTSLHVYYPGTLEAFQKDKEMGLQITQFIHALTQSLVHSSVPFKTGVE
jgi:hypothetical protein